MTILWRKPRTRALTTESSNRFDSITMGLQCGSSITGPSHVLPSMTAVIHDNGYSRREFLSMTIMDIRPGEGTVSLPREMSQEGKRDSAKGDRKTSEEARQRDRRGKHALRSALRRGYRRHRDRRRCDRTLFWPSGRCFTKKRGSIKGGAEGSAASQGRRAHSASSLASCTALPTDPGQR